MTSRDRRKAIAEAESNGGLNLLCEASYRSTVELVGIEMVQRDAILASGLETIRHGVPVAEALLETLRAMTIYKDSVLIEAIKLVELKCPNPEAHDEGGEA